MPAQHLLGLLVLLALAAGAQEVHPCKVRFVNAYPPDSKVYYLGSPPEEYWGTAEGFVAPERKVARSVASVQLVFRHEGFEPKTLTVPTGEFWPEGPGQAARDISTEIHLEATNALNRLLYWMRYRPLGGALAVLLLGVAAGGTAFGLLQLRRNFRMQVLKASADRSDPLLKDGATRLGDYLVVKKLGMGGMATVYWAVPHRTLKDEDAVAIKVVQPQFAQDPEFQRRFRRECKLAASLTHPAIVRTLASHTQEGLLYMVMELVAGQSLKSLMPPQGMPLERALALLDPVLEGLIYAHDHKVVHRDLKPENLMVVGTTCKIMDFGLAKSDEVSELTRTGTALGTPSYLAPEQLLGAPLDARSDQYAMGITLYYVLSGKLPFEGADPMAVAYRHASEVPAWPAGVTPSVGRVIMRMICKDPQQRYADFREVREALRLARQDPEAFAGWEYPAPIPRVLPKPRAKSKGDETVAMEGGDDTLVGLT